MKPPKVTVIIPTYDRSHYLGTAIQSVLDQTFTDFELIIVDDGSTDDTQQLVQSFDDKRIRYIYQENRGISAAMNAGILAANGDYIARLDSDDIWLPEMLEVEVGVLDARPEIGLVYAKAQAMDEDCNLLPEIRGTSERYPGETLRSILVMDFTCNITVVVRRTCFDSTGMYDESLNVNEDWDMWLRMAIDYRFAFVDQILARFRCHDGNITGLDSPYFYEHVCGGVKVLDKVFSQYDLEPAVAAMKPAAYCSGYLGTGRRWLNLREYRRASYFFRRALLVSPNLLFTLADIFWIIFTDKFLWRFEWGISFAKWMAALRQRFRNMRVSH